MIHAKFRNLSINSWIGLCSQWKGKSKTVDEKYKILHLILKIEERKQREWLKL